MNQLIKDLQTVATNFLTTIEKWSSKRYLNLVIFNLTIMLLVLLRSAGYFEPYFLITVNVIVMAALFLSILLLGARVRFIFLLALIFWVFSAFLRVIDVNIWAERSAIYTYQALVIGIILLVIKSVINKKTQL